MISQGKYPFKETQAETEFTPRVSDGVIELDAKGYVRLAAKFSLGFEQTKSRPSGREKA